ncbi:MAG: hypothetical protein ABGZ35_02580 [Planctomycetaceae bacterium]|jgi:hypothetical protein
MSDGSKFAFTAIVATAAGFVITVFVVTWLIASDDQGVLAAEQRFSSLSHSEAQRIIATFDRLNEPSKQHEWKHIKSIHNAVTHDRYLDHKLQQLYAWWETRDDAQRLELRELPPEEWQDEMQRQITESEREDIALHIPRPLGRGRVMHVTKQQVEQFLVDAMPGDGLPPEDTSLIESVDPEDRLLARVLVIAGRLPRSRTRNAEIDSDAVQRILNAAEKHLLPEDVRRGRREARGDTVVRFETMMSFAVLKSVKDHLSEEFLRRHAVEDEEIAKAFASLETTERITQMMSDPAAAVRSLQARARSVDENTPTGQLAARLTEFNRTLAGFRTRGQRDSRTNRGGPGGAARPNGRRYERGPGDERGRRFGRPPDREQQ